MSAASDWARQGWSGRGVGIGKEVGCRHGDQEIESKAAIQTNEQTGLVIVPKGYSQLKKQRKVGGSASPG